MREGYPGGPTWLPMSALIALTAACTTPNPSYVGVEGPPAPDAAAHDSGPGVPAPDAAAPDGPIARDGPAELALPDGPPPPNPDVPADAPTDAPADLPPAADLLPTAGLVAHWPLDEGTGVATADRSGNANDGSLINGPTWLAAGAPLAGGAMALRLDGSDDYVDLEVRTLPRAEASQTIAVWFRNAADSPRLRNLVSLFNDDESTGVHLGFDGAKVAAWRFGDVEPVVVSPGEPDGDWHHLAYTWNGTTHRLYLDGAQVDSGSGAVDPGPVETARFGTWDLPEEVFGGDLDEVRVYARALSAAEITALAGRP